MRPTRAASGLTDDAVYANQYRVSRANPSDAAAARPAGAVDLTHPDDRHEPLPDHRERNALLTFVVASLVFAALSTFMSFASKGFLEADGVTHYLYARFAFQNPAYFVDVWGRPVRMLIHAVPAHFFGLHGVRAASLACALGCAWLTYGIARRLRWEHAALAGCFVLAQPLLFMHSFSELTELPFALLVAGAFYAMVCRQWFLFALLCGMTPASRPEGAAFVLLAIVVLALHRRWHFIPLVLLPTILWNHLGWVMWGSDRGVWWRWLIDRFPYSSESAYGRGKIWRFVAVLPFVVSPLILPAVLLGTVGVVRDRVEAATRPIAQSVVEWLIAREAWLIALIPWGIFCVHSLLHWLGKMSSSGEPRYLLAVSPFWALLACRGWTMFARRFEWKMPIAWAVAAAMLPCFANAAWRVLPVRPQSDAVLCERIAARYHQALEAQYPTVYATHPLMYYTLDRIVQDVRSDLAAHPPAGGIFFYDSLYASYNSDPRRKVTPEMFLAGGWKRIPWNDLSLPDQTWEVFVSPTPIGKSENNPTPLSATAPSTMQATRP